MLDAIYLPDTRERRVAEAILERAARGRWLSNAEARLLTRADTDTIIAVRRRLIEAGLLARTAPKEIDG